MLTFKNTCVAEMRIKFVRPLQDTVAHANGMVTLRCEVCKPKADVQWLKNGVEVVPSRRYSIRADGAERSLTIHRLTREDAGEYSCESKDDRTVATLRVESKCGRTSLFCLLNRMKWQVYDLLYLFSASCGGVPYRTAQHYCA